MYAIQTHSLGPILTETDLRLFLREPFSKKSSAQPFYLSILFAVALSFLIFGFLNYNAYQRIYGENTVAIATATPAPQSTPTPVNTLPVVKTTPAPTIPENSISISGLNISAPIGFDTLFDEKIIQEKLKSGTVHFQGTAKPGSKGTVVITGHSSNYPWVKGQYNSIFAPLHKAQNGQTILVNYQNKEYTYIVTKVYQVSPQDLAVLQAGEKDGLRLITCTPIGTSLRRLVVEAEQTSPETQENIPFTHTEFTGSVPGAR